MRPLVCIILVNYNGFRDTVDCIKSLKTITYENYKIIVVDNGSTIKPSTEQIRYIRTNSEYIETKKNLGFSGGNNVGIKYCEQYSPEFYLLLNNDTVVEKEFLDILVNTYNTEYSLITGRIMFYSLPDKIWYGGGDIEQKNFRVTQHGYMEKVKKEYLEQKLVTFATGCLWLLPKTTIDNVGMLDDSYFLYCEDTDYCLRILNSGKKILYNGDACIYHKISASSGDGSNLQKYYMIRNSFILIKRFGINKKKMEIYYLLKYIKMVFNRKLNSKILILAYKDYKNGYMGKRSI